MALKNALLKNWASLISGGGSEISTNMILAVDCVRVEMRILFSRQNSYRVLFVKKPTIFFENVKIMSLIILENVKIMTS